MTKRFDVLGIGCTTVDDFLYIGSFPGADDKTEVSRSDRQCGGLTATALVAASRLGAQCAYAGVMGDNELSEFVLKTLRSESIDTSLVTKRPDASPIHSTIVVGQGGKTRNIFFEISGKTGPADDLPSESNIRSSRVLFLDHYGTVGGIRAAKIARENNIPVVADLERNNVENFEGLLGLVDHLIVSHQFASKLSGSDLPYESVDRLWTKERAVVIVTCGGSGCWYRDRLTARPIHVPAFLVDVVDSTGCGDVFHGAYAAAIASDMETHDRIVFATGAAALKAKKPGGQSGIPTLAELQTFLSRMQ